MKKWIVAAGLLLGWALRPFGAEDAGSLYVVDTLALETKEGQVIATDGTVEGIGATVKDALDEMRVGSEVKQIVSGIRKYYTPEEMVGKKVMVLVNLKPAKLAGVLSEGMLLCAEDAEGNLALMTPEKPMPAGAEIC